MNVSINVNTSGLKTQTIPQIEKACSNLSKAREELAKIKEKPKDFINSEKLDKIPNRIRSLESGLSKLCTDINKKADKFESLDRKNGTSNGNIMNNMINNPDYEYYMSTQGKDTTNKTSNLFPFSDASLELEQKYAGTMANIRSSSIPSLINLCIGGIKGVTKAEETTIYGFNINQANSISKDNPDYDYYYNGNVSKINTARDMYRNETMARVSENLTQSAYDYFYADTSIGKWLEKNAGKGFKPNQGSTNFVENLGYMGTMMVAGHTPLGTAMLTYLSKKGEATRSYWSSEEVQSQIKMGINIDEIWDKGNTYGNIKGGSSAISYGLQKLTGAGGKVDKLFNRAIDRVGMDTVLAGADYIVSDFADSIVGKEKLNNKEFLTGLVGNMATAAIVSGAGEFVRYKFNVAEADSTEAEVDVEKAKNIAKENQKRFWKGYFSEEEIDENFEKIRIYKHEDWINLDYIKKNPGVVGFTSNGIAYIDGGDLDYETIEHETNHLLGNIYSNDRKLNRGMNEATTEMFAIDAVGDSSNGVSDYSFNVGILRKLKKIVDDKVHQIPGYENTDLLKISYSDKTLVYGGLDPSGKDIFVDTKGLFDEALNDIMDDPNYSNTIKKNMEIADGGNFYQYSKEEIELARKELEKMVNEVRMKVSGK